MIYRALYPVPASPYSVLIEAPFRVPKIDCSRCCGSFCWLRLSVNILVLFLLRYWKTGYVLVDWDEASFVPTLSRDRLSVSLLIFLCFNLNELLTVLNAFNYLKIICHILKPNTARGENYMHCRVTLSMYIMYESMIYFM